MPQQRQQPFASQAACVRLRSRQQQMMRVEKYPFFGYPFSSVDDRSGVAAREVSVLAVIRSVALSPQAVRGER